MPSPYCSSHCAYKAVLPSGLRNRDGCRSFAKDGHGRNFDFDFVGGHWFSLRELFGLKTSENTPEIILLKIPS